MSYAVTTQLDVYREKLDEFITILSEMADSTREAAGCLLHNVCMDAEEKGRMLIYSAWESIEQYKEYLDWDKSKGLTETLLPFLKNPPVSHEYDRID